MIVGVIVRRAVAAGVDHGSPQGTPPACTSAEGLLALPSVSQLSQARRSPKPGMRWMARCDALLATGKYDSIYLNERFERMPLYDYKCTACGHQFEALVRGGAAPTCASCGGAALERLLSLPAVKSESTKAKSLRAAKRRDAAQGTERVQEQLRYERSHDD